MIENDKANWRSGIGWGIALTIGSFFLVSRFKQQGTPFDFATFFLIQPVLWFVMFLPVLIIELISRIQRIIEKNKDKRIGMSDMAKKIDGDTK